MKRCPKCNQLYADDNLSFCLSDGASLSATYDTEQTLVLPTASFNTPPVVGSPSQSQPPSRQGVSPMFAYLAVGLLALIVGGAIVLWIKSDSDASSVAKNTSPNPANSKSNEDDSLDEQKEKLQDEQARIEREKQKLADERQKLEDQKNRSGDYYVDQPAARIRFRKGNVEETITGDVSKERSFILGAKSGQYLSASVVSSNGCVVFSNGSTSISYTTSTGDNRLSLMNNCGGQASFSLTVSIR